MTSPESDLAIHVRLSAEYEDGSFDVFAVDEGILRRGRADLVLAIADEWQDGGYLRDGAIVAVRPGRYSLN